MPNPFTKLVACELGPNYQTDDAIKAIKLLLNLPFKTSQKPLLKTKKYLSAFLNLKSDENIWLVDSGRTALYLILKNLNLPKNSEVLLQGFSCVVVPNSILQSGLKPVVCDIDENDFNFDLEKIESKITSKTKVWIVQYSFGIVPNLKKIKEIFKKHIIILIEDVAHALGSEYGNQKIGAIGDGAIFSFGRDKIISSTIGGALVINKKDKKWAKGVEEDYQNLAEMSFERIWKSLVYLPLLVFLVKPFYHFFGFGKFILFSSQKARIVEPVYTKDESVCTFTPASPSKFSPLLADLVNNQFRKIKKFTAHRKSLAKYYAEKLNLDFNDNSTYLRYPVDLNKVGIKQGGGKQRFSKIFEELRKVGVLAGNWYGNYFLPQQVDLKTAGVIKKDLPTTTRLLGSIINLPTNINTTKKDAEKIVKTIKKNLD